VRENTPAGILMSVEKYLKLLLSKVGRVKRYLRRKILIYIINILMVYHHWGKSAGNSEPQVTYLEQRDPWIKFSIG